MPATPALLRSRDQGLTWESLSNTGTTYYCAVIGDGTRLYIHPWTPSAPWVPFRTSLETDGQTWTDLDGGGGLPRAYPTVLRYDRVNRVLYAATQAGGIWARLSP
jgi:hypothetical protein